MSPRLRVRSFHHTLPPPLELVPDSAKSPFLFPSFAPTNAKLARSDGLGDQVNWNSRAHRKQRYRAVSPRGGRPRHTSELGGRILRLTRIEYWNVSWWVAFLFTIGSVVWVINGFQVFLPFVTPISPSVSASGWSAWVGASIFVAGSILLILEAWNRDDGACFGYALKHTLLGNRHRLTGRQLGPEGRISSDIDEKEIHDSSASRWIWWSTDRKYWHEIGFVAAFVQLCAATIFWISGFTGLPEVQESLSKHPAALKGIYWSPQVIGGVGFILSSVLYMLEAQTKWYLPAPHKLGWHIGFWNLIGALGFTLCGVFGYSTAHSDQYEATLSTFWGSWAFLIGSVIQWYEAVNPVKASQVCNEP